MKALCSINKAIFDVNDFKPVYENLKYGGNRKIDKETAQNVLYFLREFLIIEFTNVKTRYRLTDQGRNLCTYQRRGDVDSYKAALAKLLLENEEKGTMFRVFLDYVSTPRNLDEVNDKFRRNSLTLRKWSEYAGRLSFDGKTFWTTVQLIKTKEEFWSKLKVCFANLSKLKAIGARSMFVKISDIYRQMLPYLDPKEPNSFDRYLESLMLDRSYSNRIQLSGAPLNYVTRENLREFEFRNRKYYFISLLAGVTSG